MSNETVESGKDAADALQRKLKLLSGFPADDLPPTILRLDYEPWEIHLYVTSRVERKSRTKSCAKEPWTIRWIESRVRQGDVVYDIGANVGAYSLIAAHHVRPSGRVVAVEPSYSTFAHLCDNIILNDLSDVVIPVPLSIKAVTDTTRIHFNSLAPGHARHSVSDDAPAPRTDRKVRASLHTLAISLDDLVDRFRLPAPHYMKVDVDGSELDVLRGATRLLALPSLRSVITEVEDVHTDETVGLFGKFGFSVSERHRRTAEDGTPAGWWFGVFTRGEGEPLARSDREAV